MKRPLLVTLLAGAQMLFGGEWRPQIQERGEALYGLTFSPDGNWALSIGGNSWSSRYSTQGVVRLWSVQSQACVWKLLLQPEASSGQIMADPVGVLEGGSSLVQWTEFGDNSDESVRGRWLGLISDSGELL